MRNIKEVLIFMLVMLLPVFAAEATTCPNTAPGFECFNNTFVCGSVDTYQCITQDFINQTESGTCPDPLQTKTFNCGTCTATCICPAGYTDCSGQCKPSSSPSCPSPSIYNPCTGTCNTPTSYIIASPATAQADFINISGNVKAASSTMAGSGYFGGEAMFGSYWNGTAMTSPITLSSGKNLLYGQINSGSTGGNLMLLEKGTGGTASPLFAINYSGRVGIGTSTPTHLLHIQGASTSWSGLRINRGDDPTYFEILHYGGTGSGTTLRQSGNMPIRFFTNGVDRMSITGSGRVGIGTLSPNRTLHVSSTVENAEIDIQSGGKNHWAIYHDFGSEDLRFWNTDAGGSNALILSNTGNAYVAGEFKSSWLHVTSTDPNSFNSMANRLVVGLTQAREDYGDVNTASKKATLYALNNQPTYSGPTPNSSDQQATAIFGRSFYGHAGAFSNGFSSATTGNWSTLVAQNFNPVNTVSALYAENLSTQPSSKAVQGISNSGWSGYFTGTPSTSKGVFATRLCLGSETDCKTSWSAVGGMPGGVAGQTLRNDGTNWVATSNLYNNGINIGIGTTAPNRLLHIASSTGNAEIDIQSGGKNHWAIYHDFGSEDLRFWNTDAGGSNALILSNTGNAYVAGEFKSSWLHVTSTDPNSFNSMANRLVVGVAQSVENGGNPDLMSKKATFYAFNNQSVYTGSVPNSSDQQATAIFGRSVYGHAGAFSNGYAGATATNWSTLVAQNFNPVNTVSALYAENFSTQPSSKAVQGISNSGWSGYFTGATSTSKGVFATRLCLGSETDCRTSWSGVSATNTMPTGAINQTLRHDGANWVATSNLYNNGINVGILGNLQINKSTAELLVGDNTTNTLRLVGAMPEASYIQVGVDGNDTTGVLTVSRRNTVKSAISRLNVYATNSYFSGNVGIGISTPNKSLHIASGTGNAEIDIQSGDNTHWGIYQVKDSTDVDSVLRFWQTDDVLELKGDNASSVGNQSQVIVKNELCLGGVCKSSWPSAGGVYTSQASVTTGGGLGGYKAYNNRCPSGSHVCTTEEILNSINQNVSGLPISGDYWVNGGNPGGVTTAMNDCKGRTSSSSADLGFFWKFDSGGGRALLTSCNNSKAIACCK